MNNERIRPRVEHVRPSVSVNLCVIALLNVATTPVAIRVGIMSENTSFYDEWYSFL